MTYPKENTQERKVLDALLEADGAWLSKRVFAYQMMLTQSGRALHTLENRFGWKIEHSPFTDPQGFKSYRITQRVRQLELAV